MTKYFTEIMPKIRQNGKYILDNANKLKLNKMNRLLKDVKDSNKLMLNNQRNIRYPIGNAIYIS